ncbi:MAG: ATP-binding protein [Pseudomonadota bacterium]
MFDLNRYLSITNHLTGKLDIIEALQAVEDDVRDLITFDHLDVCLINGEGMDNRSYEIGLRTGWSAGTWPISSSPVRSILLGEVDAMVTGNAIEDARYFFTGADSGPMAQHSLLSRINVAMKVLGRTVGALNFSVQRQDYYTDDDVEKARILGDILAPYFYALRTNETAKREAVIRTKVQAREEGLRQGAMRLTDALEGERQRIGMDLHDQTLGELTRIARMLRPRMCQAQTERLQMDIQTCIQGVRDIIDTSIPSILELFGFQEAVRSHFERTVGDRNAPHFRFVDHTGEAIDALHETTRIALFRVCQEALNNAISHSGASRVQVMLAKGNDGSIMMTIEDDGRFRAREDHHIGGLTHMATRARLIGADLTMDTEDGVRIRVHYPGPKARPNEVPADGKMAEDSHHAFEQDDAIATPLAKQPPHSEDTPDLVS